MKVGLVYFSATGNTAKIARAIEERLHQLGIEIESFNITPFNQRQGLNNMKKYDFLIFGFPVYAWRIPKVVREWLKTLDGKSKKCSMFFTYGGVSMGIAHHDTKRILLKQGFTVISSAEFPGKHTYNLGGWDLLENRPNIVDIEVAREYAEKTIEKNKNQENAIQASIKNIHIGKIQLEYISKQRSSRFTQLPRRDEKDCSMCKNCENECPTNAFDADLGVSDIKKCITCLHCVSICPDNVITIKMLPNTYQKTFKKLGLTKELIDNRESIYFL